MEKIRERLVGIVRVNLLPDRVQRPSGGPSVSVPRLQGANLAEPGRAVGGKVYTP